MWAEFKEKPFETYFSSSRPAFRKTLGGDADERGAADGLAPLQGDLDHTRRDLDARAVAIGPGELSPFGNEHRLDPRTEAGQGAPQVARHDQCAPFAQAREIEIAPLTPHGTSSCDLEHPLIGIGEAGEVRRHGGDR